MSFTAASLAAARAVRDLLTVVGEVIDALIPAEATDQAEALAKAEEEREVWGPGESAWALQKLVESYWCRDHKRTVGDCPEKCATRRGRLTKLNDDFAACGGDADAGSSHPTSAPSAKQDTAPHTDSETPPLGTPGGETPRSAAGHPDPPLAERLQVLAKELSQ